jgi:hypothetical protein
LMDSFEMVVNRVMSLTPACLSPDR